MGNTHFAGAGIDLTLHVNGQHLWCYASVGDSI
jgi:hypothetical protein